MNKPFVSSDSLLVGPGKSSRLQAMRANAMSVAPPSQVPQPNKITASRDGESPELLLARQLIDARLAEIFAALPPGKQRSLFKVRFGVEPDSIKSMPLKQAFALLGIVHPNLRSPSSAMKGIGELDYQGNPTA